MPGRPVITPLTVEFVENELFPEYSKTGMSKALKKYRIDANTFAKFLAHNPKLEEQLGVLQAFRAELMVDEAIDIADTDEDAHRARNRIDVRKWAASKFKPTKFADRIDFNIVQTVDIRGAIADARTRTLQVVSSLALSSPDSTSPDINKPE